MAIVLVTEESIPPGYRFSMTEKLAVEIAARNYPVYLVSVKGDGNISYPGVTHVPVDVRGWSLFSLKQRIRANLKLCYKVLTLCQNYPVKLVYGWWPILFFARYLAQRNVAADIPEFLDVMYRSFGKPLPWLMGPILRTYQNSVARASSIVITQSDISRAIWFLRGVPYERTYAMPYGVECDVFGSAERGDFRKRYEIGEDEVMVLYHGDIGIDDGVDILIEAARELPVKVIIAGNGSPNYMRYLKSLSANSVLFLGWIPYKEMPKAVASADICVAPFRSSLYTNSTCPLKPMEAMAAGKATVISAIHTFLRYTTDGVDCRHVKPGNVNHLRQVLSELVANPQERARLGQNAREVAKKRFDWRIRVRKEASILIELAENPEAFPKDNGFYLNT